MPDQATTTHRAPQSYQMQRLAKQLEAAGLSPVQTAQPPAVATPDATNGPTIGALEYEIQVPAVLVAPEPAPAPAPAPPASTPAPEPAPVVDPAPAPAADTVPPVDWAAELAEYQERIAKTEKRLRDTQSALGPAQQKAAKATKALEANAEMLASIMAKLEALEQRAASPVAPEPPKPTSLQFEPEFQEAYPGIPEKLNAFEAMMSARLERIERENREAEERRAAAMDADRNRMYQDNWVKTVESVHPELREYVGETEKGNDLAQWASRVAPEYENALRNPLSVTPQFFIKLMAEYKMAKGMAPQQAIRKPLADLANPVLMGAGAPGPIVPPAPERVLTQQEMRNIYKLVEAAARRGDQTEALSLMDAFERQLKANRR